MAYRATSEIGKSTNQATGLESVNTVAEIIERGSSWQWSTSLDKRKQGEEEVRVGVLV